MRWTPTGWIAEFVDEDGGMPRRFAVERWADNGDALIGHESGRLVPARKQPGFKGIYELSRPVTVIPAAPGWTVRGDAFGHLESFTAPIAAWVMSGEGSFYPVFDAGWQTPDSGPVNPNPNGSHALQEGASSRYHIVPPTP